MLVSVIDRELITLKFINNSWTCGDFCQQYALFSKLDIDRFLGLDERLFPKTSDNHHENIFSTYKQ